MALAACTIAASGGRGVRAQAPADPPGPTSAASGTAIVDQPALITADDLLLLETSADGETLSDGLGAYSARAGVFLPLGEIARLLDLAITVDPATRRAEGWVTAPADGVRLDLASREAHAGGRDFAFSPAQAALFGGEIYVRLDLFQQLLPLVAKVDVSALTLTLAPTARLPFEERREREKRRFSLAGAQADHDEAFLRIVTPYEAFTPPAIDFNLDTAAGNREPRKVGQYDIRLAGDLAWAGLQVFAGSDDTLRLSDVRVLLERKDPEGRIAGPLGATRTDLGDTYTPALALGPRSEGGRGLAITSAPLEQASVFDHVDLRGELPIGWEVELYVDEVLRASQSQPIQGQYEFLGVSLAYGENVVRLVFYGPRGERREEVRRLSVAGGQLARGQSVYNLGIVQQGRPLFDVRRASSASAAAQALTGSALVGLSAPAFEGLPGDGALRIAASVSHGLSSALTATAGFAQYAPRLGDTRQVGVASLSSAVDGAFLQLDAARDDRGGSAAALGLAGRVAGVSIVARDAEYSGGFIDEIPPGAVGSAIDLKRDSTASFDFVERVAGHAMPMTVRLTRDEFEDGERRWQAQGRLSEAIGRYLISSGLDYQSDGGGKVTANRTLAGAFDASGLTWAKWQLRGDLAYDVLPSARLTTVLLTADRQVAASNAVHLALGHAFDARQTSFQVGDTWRLPVMDVSVVGSYTTNPGDFRIGLQLSLGLTWDPFRRRYRALGPGAASGGAALIEAVVSGDGGPARRPSDQPVVGLAVQGGGRTVKTDAAGAAIVTGLGDGAYAQVQVDPESIDNPYLTAPPALIRLVPRPGRVAVVPYPLSLTGEVEIRVLFEAGDEAPRGLSALAVQLVDAAGRVAARGRTEYDGAAVFDRLAPGRYVLRLDPDQAGRLRLALVDPVEVTIPRGGGFAGRVRARVAAAPAAPRQAQATTGAAVGATAVVAASPIRAAAAPHVHRRHHRHFRRHRARALWLHRAPSTWRPMRRGNGSR